MLQIATNLNFFAAINHRLDSLRDNECFVVKFNHTNGLFHPATPPQAASEDFHKKESASSAVSQSCQITISVESLGARTESGESIAVKFTKTTVAQPSSTDELQSVGGKAKSSPNSKQVDVQKQEVTDKPADCLNETLYQEEKISKTHPRRDGDGTPSDVAKEEEDTQSPKRKRRRVDGVEFVIHPPNYEEEVQEFSQKNEFAIQSFGDDNSY